MAKTNKYTSINFNHIYEKTLSTNSNPNTKPIKNPSSSSSPSYSAISSPKTHGRMLVLTRTTPKPVTTPPPQGSQLILDQARPEPGLDQISLRSLGRTGVGSPVLSPVPSLEREKEAVPGVVTSPKPDKFVPPHLRPGFAGREERPGPDVGRARESGLNNFGPPGRYLDDGRPKSGGESDMGMASRPRSSGSRPNLRGWYATLSISLLPFLLFNFCLPVVTINFFCFGWGRGVLCFRE